MKVSKRFTEADTAGMDHQSRAISFGHAILTITTTEAAFGIGDPRAVESQRSPDRQTELAA